MSEHPRGIEWVVGKYPTARRRLVDLALAGITLVLVWEFVFRWSGHDLLPRPSQIVIAFRNPHFVSALCLGVVVTTLRIVSALACAAPVGFVVAIVALMWGRTAPIARMCITFIYAFPLLAVTYIILVNVGLNEKTLFLANAWVSFNSVVFFVFNANYAKGFNSQTKEEEDAAIMYFGTRWSYAIHFQVPKSGRDLFLGMSAALILLWPLSMVFEPLIGGEKAGIGTLASNSYQGLLMNEVFVCGMVIATCALLMWASVRWLGHRIFGARGTQETIDLG